MRIVTKMLVFQDGSIGYTRGPEGVESEVEIDSNPLVNSVEINVSDKQFEFLAKEAKDKVAKKENGKYVLKDKKDKEVI